MTKLLVTGGAGYIGSHTVRALVQSGHEVVVIDDLSSGRAEAVGDCLLAVGDMGDRGFVESVFETHGPFEGVIHFAGFIEVARSVTEPLAFYETNLSKAATLVAICIERGVGAFVFSSTAAVYGIPESQPIAESAVTAPINPYGSSKAMLERVLQDAHSAHGMPWIALRYFNACGADPAGGIGEDHDPETHLIPLAIAAAAGRRDELKLFGTDYPTPDGTCVRDYIHVNDLASAHVLAVEGLLAGKSGGPYNLGTGVGNSNREILQTVGDVVGTPVPFTEADRRPGDPAELVADATRFKTDFGWEPQSSDLVNIVETAYAWHRSRWS